MRLWGGPLRAPIGFRQRAAQKEKEKGGCFEISPSAARAQACLDALYIAGVQCLRLLHESTAIALAWRPHLRSRAGTRIFRCWCAQGCVEMRPDSAQSHARLHGPFVPRPRSNLES